MTKQTVDVLIRALRAYPCTGSAELCARLGGINRSTLTRALKALGDLVVSGGEARRTRYALRRALRGKETPVPLYRIDVQGKGREIARLSLIAPSGSALSYTEQFPWPLDKDMSEGWFAGLPYPVIDMRPQGFLGRNFARNHALDLGITANPEDWSDDDIAHTLATMGFDQPGDLILGEGAYRRFLAFRRTGDERFLSDAQIEQEYLRLAELALQHGEAGSSAGGEFPKFTASRHLHGGKVGVIVKFSGSDGSPAVQRWADLLVCEHLASLAMSNSLHIPVPESAIHRFAGRTFLEVVRFDRHGDFGRSAVCTLSSLNATLVGRAGEPWPKTGQAFQAAGWLSNMDATRIALAWDFGRLIGNTDMHEGNLAFRPGLTLAPVYDMLPMMYAPLRGGEIPNKQFSPELPLPSEVPVWSKAAQAAISFWHTCAEDARVSANFQRICDENADILATSFARHA